MAQRPVRRGAAIRGAGVAAGAGALLLIVSSGSAIAAPKPAEDACMTAYRHAEATAQSGHLREARSVLSTCAKRACGTFLQHECSTAYARMETDVPTVVARATDAAGAPLVDVRVHMDGELLTSRLDGEALPVDPGLHEFVFDGAGGATASQKIMIVEGELNRHLSVVLRGPGDPPPKAETGAGAGETPPASDTTAESGSGERGETPAAPAVGAGAHLSDPARSRGSALPFVIGGAALAGAGAGGLLVYWGKKDTGSIAADAAIGFSVGVSVVALGVAAWGLLGGHPSSDDPPPARSSYVIGVQPTSSGAFATASGTF